MIYTFRIDISLGRLEYRTYSKIDLCIQIILIHFFSMRKLNEFELGVIYE